MIPRLRVIYLLVLGAIAAFQVLAFPSGANLLNVAIAIAGCVAVIFLNLQRASFVEAPLSSLVVLVFMTSNLFVPLLGTTLELKPLIFNLQMPFQTFGYTCFCVVSLSLVHLIYRRLRWGIDASQVVSKKLLGPIGLFNAPTPTQLWLMGAIGFGALAAGALLFSSKTINTSGMLPQIVNGFRPLAAAPLLLPLGPYFLGYKKLSRTGWVGFAVYLFALALVAVALGGRSAVVVPIGALLISTLLAVATERIVFNPYNPRFWVPALVAVSVGMPALGYLTTAMRMSRNLTPGMTAGQRVMKTFETMGDYKKVADYWKVTAEQGKRAGNWEETYLSNELFQRFTQLKFTDNCFYFTRNFGEQDRKSLNKYATQRFWSVFPAPAMRLLGIYYNKWSALSLSVGDFIYYQRTGFDYAALRTGSIVATGPTQFGGWFFILFPLLGVFAFFAADCFWARIMTKLGPVVIVSPIFLIMSYNFSQCLNAEAFVSVIAFFVRAMPQTVAVYLMIYYGSTVFGRVFRGSRIRAR